MKREIGIACLSGLLLNLWVLPVRADKYQGIGYSYSLNDVKAMFPRATIHEVDAAWLKPGQEAFYSLKGAGISGEIRIKFDSCRKFSPELAPLLRDKGEKAGFLASLKDLPESQQYRVSWVRWIPAAPIRIYSVIGALGKSYQTSLDQDFNKHLAWPQRGIDALLTRDQSGVCQIDYDFTPAERAEGNRLMLNSLLKHYQESRAEASKKVKSREETDVPAEPSDSVDSEESTDPDVPVESSPEPPDEPISSDDEP